MKLIIMFANVVFFLIDIDLLYFISFNVFCFVLGNLNFVNMKKLQPPIPWLPLVEGLLN